MAGQTRIDGNLIDTGTDPNDIVSVSVGDGRYPKLEGPNTLTGDLTVNGDTFYVDSANNRVGVGTSSPSEKLEVDGNVVIHGGIENPSDSLSLQGNRSLNLQGAFYAFGLLPTSTSETRVFPLFNRPTSSRLFVGTIKLLGERGGLNQTRCYVEYFISQNGFNGSFNGFITEQDQSTRSSMTTLEVKTRNDQLVIEIRPGTGFGTFSFIIEGKASVPFIYDGSFYTV